MQCNIPYIFYVNIKTNIMLDINRKYNIILFDIMRIIILKIYVHSKCTKYILYEAYYNISMVNEKQYNMQHYNSQNYHEIVS